MDAAFPRPCVIGYAYGYRAVARTFFHARDLENYSRHSAHWPTRPPPTSPRAVCRQLYVCKQTSFLRGLHNCTSCNGVARTRRYPVETPRYFIQLRLCMILYDQIALQTARPTLPRCVSGVEPCINRPTHLRALNTYPDNTRAGQDPCLAGRSTSLLYVGGQGSAGPAEPEEEYEYEEYYEN